MTKKGSEKVREGKREGYESKVAESPDFKRLRLFKNKTAPAPAPAPGEL